MKHIVTVSKASTLDDIVCAVLGNCAEARCEADNQVEAFGKCFTKTSID